MKTWLLLLLLALTSLTNAQRITIHGKIIDRIKKAPLPFASVSINGKAIGVASNDQGEFDFHIPTDFHNDIFAVNMIGYKTFEAPVWTLLRNDTGITTIEMKPATHMLQEAVVVDKIKPGEILKIAISKIDQNYPSNPFLLDGFYRDVKRLGGTYVSLLEAAVKIQDEDYLAPRSKHKLRERVALKEVRRSLGYSSKFIDFFNKDNMLEELLLNNFVRYRLFPDDESFFNNVNLEKETTYINRGVFALHYSKDFDLKVIVDKVTFGILHLEYMDNKQIDLGKIRNLTSKRVKIQRSIDFKYYEKKLYLNYFTVTSQVNWYDVESGQLKFETELQQQLMINEVHPNSSERISSEQKMKNYGLQYQNQPYNQNFWSSYNVIKATPLDKKIIEDLEQEAPLEKQFKK